MLTKEDLQQLKKIIKDETDPINERLISVESNVKVIKKDVAKMRKDIDVIVNVFDREYLELRARVDRLEEYLKIPNLQ